jgi:hypothetical protein
MKSCHRLFFILSFAGAFNASAGELDQLDRLTQDQFSGLSRDFAAIAAYRSVTPANALGLTGFDIGAGGDAIKLQASSAFAIATGSSNDSTLYTARFSFAKGLPYGIDIGATATLPSGSGATIFGGELRYALMQDGLGSPAVAVRGHYSQAFGMSQLDVRAYGADLMISKKLAIVTPFAGAGVLRTDAVPNGIAGLSAERFNVGRYFIGLNANFLVLDVAVEADRTGDVDSISAKLGWRF